jgi:hypothetical protein
MVEAKFLIHDLLAKIQDPKTKTEERRKAEDQLRSLE